MNIFVYESSKLPIDESPYEVVETKGKGHPDNICDALAEQISANYSKHCLSQFGMVPRHMVDKITILGGGSIVRFGGGEMKNPIRLILNGRFTGKIGEKEIDYLKIAEDSIKGYLSDLFPLLDINRFLIIEDNTHSNEGPGVVFNLEGATLNDRKDFFSASGKEDKQIHENRLRTNDTSTTVSYFPLSRLEQLVLKIEKEFNSPKYKELYPDVGSDIKVMGIRKNNDIDLTLCVPLIARYIPSKDAYKHRLGEIKEQVYSFASSYFPQSKVSVHLNTRDNFDKDDLYLTLIGSAIESGDEGAVGRGNRSRGLIPFTRNISMEAPSGKNPMYHTGKLFTAIGDIISEKIYNAIGKANSVFMTSQMGGYIADPWSVAVEVTGRLSSEDNVTIRNIIETELGDHAETSLKIINGLRRVNNY